MTDTSWVKPGAPVAYFTAGRREGGLTVTTVRTVAKLTFTVEGLGERFRLRDMRTKTLGGSWGFHYRAVHPESEEAAQVTEATRHRALRSAVFPMLRHDADSLTHVDKAIAVLKTWRAELIRKEGGR